MHHVRSTTEASGLGASLTNCSVQRREMPMVGESAVQL